MKDLRKIEVLKNDIWEEIEFYNLRKGDKFRMFELTGEKVIGNKNDTEFIAIDNPFASNGEWGIDCE